MFYKKCGSAEKTPTKTQIPGMGVYQRAPDSAEEAPVGQNLEQVEQWPKYNVGYNTKV